MTLRTPYLLFIGDAPYLKALTRNDAPLEDDFPRRITVKGDRDERLAHGACHGRCAHASPRRVATTTAGRPGWGVVNAWYSRSWSRAWTVSAAQPSTVNRSAMPPANGCPIPHNKFWMASAIENTSRPQ